MVRAQPSVNAMTAADGGPALALVKSSDDLPTGIDTGIRLTTADARAAHTAVQHLGCEAGDLLDWEPPRSCSRFSTKTESVTT